MSRYFAPISLNAFRAKIDEAWQGEEYKLRSITPQVQEDLEKVEFDMENTSTTDPYGWKNDKHLLGYQELDNGMMLLGVNAGGDWEVPIFFCIYWDGKKLRGYIPKFGNTWNRLTNTAIGNDSVKDAEYLFSRTDGTDPGYVKGAEAEYVEQKMDDIYLSKDKIIQDIKERILPKP